MSTVLSLVGVVIALVIASVVIAVVFDRVISYGPFLTREERRARRERAEEHQARRRERDAWPHRQQVEVLLENPPDRWPMQMELDRRRDALIALGRPVVPQLVDHLQSRLSLDGAVQFLREHPYPRTESMIEFVDRGRQVTDLVLDVLGRIGDPRAVDVTAGFLGTRRHEAAAVRALARFPPVPAVVDSVLDVLSGEPSPGQEPSEFTAWKTSELRDLLVGWRIPVAVVIDRLDGPLTDRSRALLLYLLADLHDADRTADAAPFLSVDTDEAIVLYAVFAGFSTCLRHAAADHPDRSAVSARLVPFATGRREAKNRHRYDPVDDGFDHEPPHFGIEQAAVLCLTGADRAGQKIAVAQACRRLDGFGSYRTVWDAVSVAVRCDDDVATAVTVALRDFFRRNGPMSVAAVLRGGTLPPEVDEKARAMLHVALDDAS